MSKPTATAEPTKPTAMRQVASFARELILVVVGAIIVSSLLRMFVGQMFIIPSQSMENTLLVGDRVVVQKITDFDRGDVVVFADPGTWLTGQVAEERGPVGKAFEFIGVLPDTSTGHLIKRVVGLPGDRVKCCDDQGRLSVNGQPLDESGYLYTDPSGEQIEPSEIDFEVVVPKDRIFVLGDHRDLSADSRCHLSEVDVDEPRGQVAFVPIDLVVGPAFAIAAPFNRAKLVRDPASYASVPDATSPAPEAAEIKPKGVTC